MGRHLDAIPCPVMKAAPPNRTMVRPRKTGSETPSSCSIMALLMPAFEVGGPNFLVRQQLAPSSLERDIAVDHDIAAMGQLEGVKVVLLDQEHGHFLLPVDVLDHLENLLHDERGKAKGRLVQQKQARLAHQRAADGEH